MLRGPVGALAARPDGLFRGQNLPLDLVGHLVDRGVHVLARLVRMEVVVSGVNVDLDAVQPVLLAVESHLSLHGAPEEALQLGDFLVRVDLDRIGRVHVPKRDRDVHEGLLLYRDAKGIDCARCAPGRAASTRLTALVPRAQKLLPTSMARSSRTSTKA